MKLLLHQKCHFRTLGVHFCVRGHRHNLFAFTLLHQGDQGHIPAVIHLGPHLLKHTPGKNFAPVKKPEIDGILLEGIVEISGFELIRGLKRPDLQLFSTGQEHVVSICIEKQQVLVCGRQLVTENIMVLLGLFNELLAEFGMGNLGQLHNPLENAFPPDFRNTVFSNHKVNVTPGGGDPGTFA